MIDINDFYNSIRVESTSYRKSKDYFRIKTVSFECKAVQEKNTRSFTVLSSFILRFSLVFALLSEFVEPQFLRVIGHGEADFVSTPFISGDTFSICRSFKQL